MLWNFSITALESFLINNDFLSEKVPCGTRGISILSSFCDHVFLLNSLAWRGKKPFLGVVDLGSVWSSWAPGHLALGEAPKEPNAGPSGAAGNAATCTLNNGTVLRHVCNFRLLGDRKCST
jgi:hypothetical protein